ncbi:hypothetical protein GCM10009841_19890 [Microlunatus panaciterrae]|uniref:Prenyltransferase and squalene oxidase repeat-containing protein n=1 Tax=Microlunatus panaciterrae TaxID=400768 RepID=A0ABS2RPY1_9ACTN|nr:hypothetical protein [Microlunatus panaciterrae]MBM7800542.1 hypothetical protein [Microlunatus panaciterrae]
MSSASAEEDGPRAVGLLDVLLRSDEPSIRLQVRAGVQGAEGAEVAGLQELVRASPRVATLLSERRADGTIDAHPYRAKWYGAHWTLVTLAELGYPAGDDSLTPLREQTLQWLFSAEYLDSLGKIHGLPRLHGSIEGNAVWALLTLGLADERVETLVERLRQAQWPDGGWNCDRNASGRCSSFTESLIPLRALSLHNRTRSDPRSLAVVERALAMFLRRRLYRRIGDGAIIHPSFVELHYPCYWHYDILFALVVVAEAGRVRDDRCSEALELLESKRLPDGGFPAEHRYYRATRAMVPSQRSLVDWAVSAVDG